MINRAVIGGFIRGFEIKNRNGVVSADSIVFNEPGEEQLDYLKGVLICFDAVLV